MPLTFRLFLATLVALVATITQVDAQVGSRAHPVEATSPPAQPARMPETSSLAVRTQSLSEDFNDIGTLIHNGWVGANRSSPLGTTNWFQGTPISAMGPFDAHQGAPNAYIAANFNNTTGSTGVISNWLLTPVLSFGSNASFQFWTRKPAGTDYPDRLEVRLSRNGASTELGTGATQVGDFQEVLLSINPTLTFGVYPTTWTQYTITDLPRSGSGRIAFRYFVTNAGPTGSNSDYIGIDTVSYSAGPPAFQVGGSVTGLAGSGFQVLLNGSTLLAVAANGSFTFPGYLVTGSAYTISIASQPSAPNQQCLIESGASGTIGEADVQAVISCSTLSYPVGGTVSGLAGSGLVLRNNGGDDLAIGADGDFQFPTPVLDLESYAVTVQTQPGNPSQFCAVQDGEGQVGGGPVLDVSIVCQTLSYSIGGTVSGLSGGSLVLRNNGGDDLTMTGDGPFIFETALLDLSSYDVTVHSQPSEPSQVCTVENGQGVLSGASVTDIEVACELVQWTVTAAVIAGNGSVTPESQLILDGEPATITVSPDPDWIAWSVEADTCAIEDLGEGLWGIAEVFAPCAIEVEFRRASFEVTAAVVAGEGAIDPNVQSVPYDGVAQFEVLPAVGWRIASVTGDTCTPQEQGEGLWQAESILDDCAVEASFTAAELQALLGNGQSSAVGTGFALPLTVRITNDSGEPWPGLPVRFDAPETGPGASLSAELVTTNAQGIALVHATANLIDGSYAIVARIDGSSGIEPVQFSLTNGTASFALSADIDDGRSHARYGQILDFVVRVGNDGPDLAREVDVTTELSEGLDAGHAHWLCLTPATGCTVQGSGELIESGLQIAAGAQALWLYSVPVRLDSDLDMVSVDLEASAGSQWVDATDSTVLVVFRNGFNAAYQDGAERLRSGDHDDRAVSSIGRLEFGQPRALPLIEAGDNGRSVLAEADLGSLGSVQVQRLDHDGLSYLRLALSGPAGARISPWLTAAVPAAERAWLLRHEHQGRTVIALDLDGRTVDLAVD